MTTPPRRAGRAPGADAAYMRAYGPLAGQDSHRSPAERLLARLDGVRRTGDGRWIARCPAHDDRTPSLAVRETGDGTVLMHDHAGCSPTAILDAIGMQLSDLFAARRVTHTRPQRHAWPARDVLTALASEATVAAVAASTLARGDTLTGADRERLAQAAGRLADGARMVRGVRS